MQPPQQLVHPFGAGYLLVARVVPEEGGLGEGDCKERRHRQLPPGRPDQREGRPTGRQQDEI